MTLITTIGCVPPYDMPHENFQPQRISKTASFIVNANIAQVFPLYGAFEERKWAPGWEPNLIYPKKEIIAEGTTFSVKPHGNDHGGECASLWIVSKYEPQDYVIQYLVSTQNRFWTITLTSESIENHTKTNTTVTYTFTGLNETGNELNQIDLAKMYENELQDWGGLINSYFERKTAQS